MPNSNYGIPQIQMTGLRNVPQYNPFLGLREALLMQRALMPRGGGGGRGGVPQEGDPRYGEYVMLPDGTRKWIRAKTDKQRAEGKAAVITEYRNKVLEGDAEYKAAVDGLSQLSVAGQRERISKLRGMAPRLAPKLGLSESDTVKLLTSDAEKSANARERMVNDAPGEFWGSLWRGAQNLWDSVATLGDNAAEQLTRARAANAREREAIQENAFLDEIQRREQEERSTAGMKFGTFRGLRNLLGESLTDLGAVVAAQGGGAAAGAALGAAAPVPGGALAGGLLGGMLGGAASNAPLAGFQFARRIADDDTISDADKIRMLEDNNAALYGAGVGALTASPAGWLGKGLAAVPGRIGQTAAALSSIPARTTMRAIGKSAAQNAFDASVLGASDLITQNLAYNQATGRETPLTEGLGEAIASGAILGLPFGLMAGRGARARRAAWERAHGNTILDAEIAPEPAALPPGYEAPQGGASSPWFRGPSSPWPPNAGPTIVMGTADKAGAARAAAREAVVDGLINGTVQGPAYDPLFRATVLSSPVDFTGRTVQRPVPPVQSTLQDIILSATQNFNRPAEGTIADVSLTPQAKAPVAPPSEAKPVAAAAAKAPAEKTAIQKATSKAKLDAALKAADDPDALRTELNKLSDKNWKRKFIEARIGELDGNRTAGEDSGLIGSAARLVRDGQQGQGGPDNTNPPVNSAAAANTPPAPATFADAVPKPPAGSNTANQSRGLNGAPAQNTGENRTPEAVTPQQGAGGEQTPDGGSSPESAAPAGAAAGKGAGGAKSAAKPGDGGNGDAAADRAKQAVEELPNTPPQNEAEVIEHAEIREDIAETPEELRIRPEDDDGVTFAKVVGQLQNAGRGDRVQDEAALLMRLAGTLGESSGLTPAQTLTRLNFSLNEPVSEQVKRVLDQTAWHGTPFEGEIQQLSTDYIGAGEGAQVHGWGLYVALGEDVAKERYQHRLLHRKPTSSMGQRLKLEIPEDDVMLREDAKFSEQPTFVQKQLRKLLAENNISHDLTARGSKLVESSLQIADIKAGLMRLLNSRINYNKKSMQDAIVELFKRFGGTAATKLYRPSRKLDTAASLASSFATARDSDVANIQKRILSFTGEKPYSIVSQGPVRYDAEIGQVTTEVYGRQIYHFIASHFARDIHDAAKDASQLLDLYGIKGIRYNGRLDGECAVLFDGRYAKIIERFYDQDERGRVYFLNDGAARILFTQNADASTAIHEFQHWFTNEAGAIIYDKTIPDSPAKRMLAADMNRLGIWGGERGNPADPRKWSAKTQERVAKAFEQYFREGKAPEPEMQPLFDRMKKLLIQLYQKAKELLGLNKLPKEITEIFDRELTGYRNANEADIVPPKPLKRRERRKLEAQKAAEEASTERKSSMGNRTPEENAQVEADRKDLHKAYSDRRDGGKPSATLHYPETVTHAIAMMKAEDITASAGTTDYNTAHLWTHDLIARKILGENLTPYENQQVQRLLNGIGVRDIEIRPEDLDDIRNIFLLHKPVNPPREVNRSAEIQKHAQELQAQRDANKEILSQKYEARQDDDGPSTVLRSPEKVREAIYSAEEDALKTVTGIEDIEAAEKQAESVLFRKLLGEKLTPKENRQFKALMETLGVNEIALDPEALTRIREQFSPIEKAPDSAGKTILSGTAGLRSAVDSIESDALIDAVYGKKLSKRDLAKRMATAEGRETLYADAKGEARYILASKALGRNLTPAEDRIFTQLKKAADIKDITLSDAVKTQLDKSYQEAIQQGLMIDKARFLADNLYDAIEAVTRNPGCIV